MATLKEINTLRAKQAKELADKMAELDLVAETANIVTHLIAAGDAFKELSEHMTPADILKVETVKSALKVFGKIKGSGGGSKGKKCDGAIVDVLKLAGEGGLTEREIITKVTAAYPNKWEEAKIKDTITGGRSTGDKAWWKKTGTKFHSVK